MNYKRIFSIAAMAAVFCMGVFALAQEGPPDMEKGWSLISTPCDVSLDELKQKLGGDIEVYEWDGAEYVLVDAMERGRGYSINKNAVLNSSMVCENEAPLPEGFALDLAPGWNLIGNPYHRAATFNDAFGDSADQIGDVIYEYSGNKFKELTKDDHMKPFRGYWVYAAEAVSLDYEDAAPDCDSLSLTVLSPEGDIEVGDTVTMNAYCNSGVDPAVEITTACAWSSSDDSVLAPTDEPGVFTALAAGQVQVSAAYYNDSRSQDITVISGDDEITALQLTAQRSTLEIHQTTTLTAVATYSSGRTEDVTALVAWSASPSDAALIESSGRFYPRRIGAAEVTASLDGVTSNTVTITVIAKNLRWIGLYPQSYSVQWLPCPSDPAPEWCYTHIAMRQGTSGSVEIYGENNDGRLHTMESATWDITDTSKLSVSPSGMFTAKSEGLVGVRAYKDGVYSEWYWVYVYTSSTTDFLILEYSNQEVIVEKGRTINLGATHYHVDGYRVTAHNVTAQAAWTVADPAVGSFANGYFHGSAVGDTEIYARYAGLTSNIATLRVWEPSHLDFCDPSNPNDVQWNDGLSIATLETDCADYDASENPNVCFTAEVANTADRRVLDTCLDLYIYDENQNLVRTFQNRDCSPTALYRTTPGYHPVYQYCTEWDRKNDSGQAMPAGKYTAVARFYILYCPVIKVEFTIE